MSTGAAYLLLISTGVQDKLLQATDLLNRRLAQIKDARCRDPKILDPTPRLQDIATTHYFFLNALFKPFVATAYEYMRTPITQGIASFGNEITFSIPQFGDFFNDMVINLTLSGLGDANPNGLARYCDFPGHRLIKRARFEVNNNFLDEYNDYVYAMYYNFSVSPSRKKSYLRCIGQEIPRPLYVSGSVPGIREVKYYVDGPQTPKNQHPDLELFIPLLFWFNLDPKLAIPSASIPYGQRFIKILLAPLNEICDSTIQLIPPSINNVEIIINNIFVSEEIHEIFLNRIGFNLIRVYRLQRTALTPSLGRIQLDELKYPTETIYFGILPNANEAPPNNMTDWYKFYYIDNQPIPNLVTTLTPAPPPLYTTNVAVSNLQIPSRTINELRLTAHGVEIYKFNKAAFYDSVINFVYGSEKFNSYDEFGTYIVNFCLYNGTYQPTGYFNTSQSRENYMEYTSSTITAAAPATMIMVAVALNFLLVANGTALLRYYL